MIYSKQILGRKGAVFAGMLVFFQNLLIMQSEATVEFMKEIASGRWSVIFKFSLLFFSLFSVAIATAAWEVGKSGSQRNGAWLGLKVMHPAEQDSKSIKWTLGTQGLCVNVLLWFDLWEKCSLALAEWEERLGEIAACFFPIHLRHQLKTWVGEICSESHYV